MRNMPHRLLLLVSLAALLGCPGGAVAGSPVPRPPTKEERARYPWLSAERSIRPLAEAIAPPSGYTRVAVEDGSFGGWLRGLPLRPPGTRRGPL